MTSYEDQTNIPADGRQLTCGTQSSVRFKVLFRPLQDEMNLMAKGQEWANEALRQNGWSLVDMLVQLNRILAEGGYTYNDFVASCACVLDRHNEGVNTSGHGIRFIKAFEILLGASSNTFIYEVRTCEASSIDVVELVAKTVFVDSRPGAKVS